MEHLSLTASSSSQISPADIADHVRSKQERLVYLIKEKMSAFSLLKLEETNKVTVKLIHSRVAAVESRKCPCNF